MILIPAATVRFAGVTVMSDVEVAPLLDTVKPAEVTAPPA